MGIEDLSQFIKKNHPSALLDVSLSSFAGRRIAVDSTNVFYKIWSSCYREVLKMTDVLYEEVDREEVLNRCISRLYDFLRRVLSCEVLPIFVFDGGYCDKKKEYAHARRKKTRDSAKTRLDELDEQLKNLTPAQKGKEHIEKKRKLLAQIEGPEHEMGAMKNIICCLGLPFIQAYEEAEKVCSSLCYDGRVDAVMSSDSDNLVHGCLMLMKEIINTDEGEIIKSISLPLLLESLNLNFSSFVDFCIMCGCDYNTNMQKIGVARSYKLISKYKSIDNLPESFMNIPLDKEVLNYKDCRELFRITPAEELAEEIDLSLLETDYESLKEMNVSWGEEIATLINSINLQKVNKITTRLI